jgi:hypothetical protein
MDSCETVFFLHHWMPVRLGNPTRFSQKIVGLGRLPGIHW